MACIILYIFCLFTLHSWHTVYILHMHAMFFFVFNENVLSCETSMQASGVYIRGLMHTHVFLALCMF